MENNNFMMSGIFLGLSSTFNLPPELYEFLSRDDQGMEGLEFMLSDPELSKRIPPKVRTEYEMLYASLTRSVSDMITKSKETLDAIEKDPKKVIQTIIQNAYEKQ